VSQETRSGTPPTTVRRSRTKKARAAGVRSQPPAPAAFASRVIIEGLSPEIDGGRFAAKGAQGDPVVVEADVFTDGHERVAAALLYRHEADGGWATVAMKALVNDRWQGQFFP
jgi:starch synthase (maltosyl-transferring)